jgi:hypothetical protein
MKNYFAMAGIFAALCFTTYRSHSQTPSVVIFRDTTNCCNEISTIPNDYCRLDNPLPPYSVVTADIRIDSFVVTKDGAGHLLLYVQVSSTHDDAAREARLVILLPYDVCDISVRNMDPQINSYKQWGGRIEFCLGRLATNGPTSKRYVTIRTSMAKQPNRKGTESFAGFVFSSTPDNCPLNNYRAWVNDKVPCRNLNPATLVKKGSIH